MNLRTLTTLIAFFAAAGAQAAPTLLTNAGAAPLSGATLLTFNAETTGAFASREFGGDVTVSSSGGPLYIDTQYSSSYGTSGRYLTNRGAPGTLTFDFDGTVSAFGFNWGAADQPWTMSLFDGANQFIGSLSIAAQSGSYAGFVGVNGAGAAIGKVQLTTAGYTDYVLIDDFRYVPRGGNVPEPASLALVALGLAGVAASRRRRASQA